MWIFSFLLDLLEDKQSLSVGDLITLKVNMFLEALLVCLYMLFGYFYMLLPLIRIKVCLCSICSQMQEKWRKTEGNGVYTITQRFPTPKSNLLRIS